ncbi:MAG: helix-turn-helix domain-containing protein, partial [Microvirga sp.]
MARRGVQLREHILWTAKDVFLELGFERTSMDEVAGRAATSKRTLYAHFESKEKLFLAVIE